MPYRHVHNCCSEYQRYQLLRAIHNCGNTWFVHHDVVPNIKDINFWEQFTTIRFIHTRHTTLFRISKISTFESNSQPVELSELLRSCCSEYQRYQLLRAIHNGKVGGVVGSSVVPNIKDINFWEQFTTFIDFIRNMELLFRISKISTFESNSQHILAQLFTTHRCSEYQRYQLLRAIHNPGNKLVADVAVVPNIKDINFWEQFTTCWASRC